MPPLSPVSTGLDNHASEQSWLLHQLLPCAKLDMYRGGSKPAGIYNILKIVCGGAKPLLRNLWTYETKERFCRFFHELHNNSTY